MLHVRFELTTYCLQNSCTAYCANVAYWLRVMESNHLPLGYEPTEIPLLQPAIILLYIQSGVPGEIRTLDQEIKSLLLLPTELRVHYANFFYLRKWKLVKPTEPHLQK